MRRRQHESRVWLAEQEAKVAVVIEQHDIVSYRDAYARQLDYVDRRCRSGKADDIFMLFEHHPVFTLGRNGSVQHVAVSREFLAEQGIELIRVERGGEVTYHGPGQLVCYPVIDLRKNGLSVSDYISQLEQVMLVVVRGFGLAATRDKRNYGIWVEDRKIGSVGIAIRHGITYHGLALNVNLALEPFSWINPCGLSGISMTSMAHEMGCTLDMAAVKEKMVTAIGTVFNYSDLRLKNRANDNSVKKVLP